MICNNNYLADILRVCEIRDLIWVMRFQSPKVNVDQFLRTNTFENCQDTGVQKGDKGLQRLSLTGRGQLLLTRESLKGCISIYFNIV